MRQAPTHPKVVLASALRTVNGDSGVLADWGGRQSVSAKLIVTAISGAAATLNLTVEHADTAAGSYTAVDTFPAQTITTTGITRLAVGLTKPFARLAWTITGTTPQITFSVTFALTESLQLVG